MGIFDRVFGRTNIQLASSTKFDEKISDIETLVQKEDFLLNSLYPITEIMAMRFFRTLGVKKPTEYSPDMQIFTGFRPVLFPKGAAISIWFLTIDDSKTHDHNALYVNVEDPVLTLGLVVCKIKKGMVHTFLGYYRDYSELKDMRGL